MAHDRAIWWATKVVAADKSLDFSISVVNMSLTTVQWNGKKGTGQPTN